MNFNRFGPLAIHYFLKFSLTFFSLLLLIREQPLVRRYINLKRLRRAVPFSCHLTRTGLAVACREANLLNTSIVEAVSLDKNLCTASRRSKIRFNVFDLNIVVTEIYWLSSELLAIKGNINIVRHVIRVVSGKLRNFSENESIFVEAFSASPIRFYCLFLTSDILIDSHWALIQILC